MFFDKFDQKDYIYNFIDIYIDNLINSINIID